MAIVAGDWTIDRVTKKIAYVGGDHGAAPTYATVIEFHRWLQDLADDAVAIASSGDELDITNTDPSRRSTDNIITLINDYTLDETAGTPASEHLYDGSIIESGGDRIFDGIVNFGNSTVVIQILQDGTVIADDWWNLSGGTGANPDAGQGVSHRFMIKTREDGVDIDGRRLIGTSRVMDTAAGIDHKTFSEFKINGTARGNNVLALTNTGDLNNTTSETTISGWTNITNTEGLNLIDVDADTVNEEYYSQWTDDDTPDRSQNDYYERLKWLTRDASASTIHGVNGETFRGITHSFPVSGAGWDPVTNDLGVWGTAIAFDGGVGTFTVGEAIHEDTVIPVWKGRVIGYTGAGATGTLIVDIESGTVLDPSSFTGQGSGATADVNVTPTAVIGGGEFNTLAIDDQGATGTFYVQVTKGTAPPNSGIVYESTILTNTLTLTSAPTERAVATPFIGASTGTNIVGAYGIGFSITDIDDSDILTAFDGLQYSRPNLVTNAVGGLTFTGDVDRVIVAPWDGVTKDINDDPAIDKGQLVTTSLLNTVNVASIQVSSGTETAIPADTPSSGTIRVTDDDGFERFIPYTSWTGTTFTVDTGHPFLGSNNDFDGLTGSGTYQASAGNDVYISYLDISATAASHSYQGTYTVDRDLVALVRNGGTAPIKQFIAEWTFKSTGQTLNAIRTTDT